MFASNTSQVSGDAVFVEDVYSTFLYQGNGSTQTITNGIDLAGKGGLVWIKDRTTAFSHYLYDTVRGATNSLSTDSTGGTTTAAQALTSFNSTGFSLSSSSAVNLSNDTYASWTFRKQPKFFDVVTYTGNGAASRTISHNLGSAPGVLILKNVSNSSSWSVFHRSLGVSQTLLLNDTTGAFGASGRFGSSAPTATTFDINATYNTNGDTYVAYLFAHNAGGFGLTGTDNVISCGSFTTDGSGNATVSLGYEPQWVLVKPSSAVDNWFIFDNMRGLPVNSTGAGVAELKPNSADAEATAQHIISPTATGFAISGGGGFGVNTTCIYIAIRRGPMKTPTSGTSVFSPVAYTGNGSSQIITAGFPVDLSIQKGRSGTYGANAPSWNDRLRGAGNSLNSTGTFAEFATNAITSFSSNTSVTAGTYNNTNGTSTNYIDWLFARAPGFFDEVCWTGDGTGNARNHNLAVYPELVISKLRSGGAGFGAWNVQNNINPSAKQTGFLNTTAAFSSSGATSPTATVFYPTDDQSGATYVTYLFASCPGVSKCGSYTGTGTTQQINCGFTGGARFVLIKRTDSTGDWYVWDTARGIVSGNDPYLLLNSTAAEVTSTDYIDTYSAGFEISSTAPAAINASGGSFVYLAIA